MPTLLRALILSTSLLAASSWAQAISGSMTLSPQPFNQFGGYDLQESIALSCTLVCPPSAPTLHYAVRGLGDFYYQQTGTTFGYMGTGFLAAVDLTGSASGTATSLPAGASYYAKLTSVTCECGGRTGEGGYIDITSNTVHVPPYVNLILVNPAGQETLAFVDASPQGAETVTVTTVGGGLNTSATFGPNDFLNGTAHTLKSISFTPTQAGDVVLTATLNPSGAAYSATATIAAGSSGAGGGGGGSGSGGGGGSSQPGGCATVPLAELALPLALLALSRRRGR